MIAKRKGGWDRRKNEERKEEGWMEEGRGVGGVVN